MKNNWETTNKNHFDIRGLLPSPYIFLVIAGCCVVLSCDDTQSADSAGKESNVAVSSVVLSPDSGHNQGQKTDQSVVSTVDSQYSKEIVEGVKKTDVKFTDLPWDLYVVDETSELNLAEGTPNPPIGTTIYPAHKIPKVACGAFWIHYGDGIVRKVYSCNHEDPNHTAEDR